MKVRVGCDERYPDYCISNDAWDPEIDLTNEEIEKINTAEILYKEAQKILERAYPRKR